MKKKIRFLFNPRGLITAAILGTGIVTSAQSVSDAQTRKKSYQVNAETTLEIENKFGTILIVPWKKDSVQITADIFLEAKSTSRLRKLKNEVEVDFTGSSRYIIARTKIGDSGSRIASELRALSNTLGSNSRVEINYTVYVPDYINLVLNNKFGNIYIDDLKGDVDISLSNGDLKANYFSGNSKIELIFAKGVIRNLGTTSLNMSYAELQIGNIEQLDLVSKSSELIIDKAGVVKMESRRDKIKMNEVEYLYGNSSFTEVKIRDFIREADCKMNYGDLDIENILPEFSRINVESDFTDITLYTSGASKFYLNVIHNEKAIVNIPGKMPNFKTLKIGEETLRTEGIVGVGDSDKRISIRADHKCYITISIR